MCDAIEKKNTSKENSNEPTTWKTNLKQLQVNEWIAGEVYVELIWIWRSSTTQFYVCVCECVTQKA